MNRLSSQPPTEIVPLARIQYVNPPRILKKSLDKAKASLKEHGQIKTNIILTIPREYVKSRRRKPQPEPKKQTKTKKPKTMYTVRAGDLEIEAARALKWKEVKAIVIPHEWPKEGAISDWVDILQQHQSTALSDYQIAKLATDMETKWQATGSMFAHVTGVSKPYVYNLMRWFRHAPPEVRDAWKEKHPLINQSELESYTHMDSLEEAQRAWQMRLKTMAYGAFKPGRNGYSKKEEATRRRRASERQLTELEDMIRHSALTKPIKDLCTNIIRFALGINKSIPGITNRTKKLHSSITKETNAPS